MNLCRYDDDGMPRWGLIEEGHVYALEGDPFAGEAREAGSLRPTLARGPLVGPVDAVRLLAPLRPGKIVCVGRNYAAHAAELGNEVPTEPMLFYKPPSSVIGPGEAIELLPEMGMVHHESELAVVIGQRGRFIEEANAFDHVLGYTVALDISDRDFQKKDGQWARAKGFDTFCPLGPWIAVGFDPTDVRVTCRVNGELRQDGQTALMIHSIPKLIRVISRVMTLEPGDVILTGTPAGVGPIRPGDVIEAEVEGIGVLRSPVIALDA